MPSGNPLGDGSGLPDHVEIGSRFISEDDFGTLRFIGEVPPTKGLWLGVEWDKPDRGKHDGSHNGVCFFQASSPAGGSFIRAKKADFGVDFFTALRQRYVPDDEVTADVDEREMYIRGANNQITRVEMVGAAKVAREQSTFASLKDAVLRDMKISHVGTAQLEEEIPRLMELDVSRNLLPSWQVVSELTGQLKQLKCLKLSKNRLQIPASPTSLSSAFLNLRQLFLNYMNLTWDMLLECAPMWPSLKELHVCFNQISSLGRLAPGTFERMELLNLEGNQLGGWSDVMCLSHLPRLEALILNSNRLTSVEFADTSATSKTEHFACLKSLSLSDNCLDSWQTVGEMEKLSRLAELRMRRNPFMRDMAPADLREQLIARLGGLKICNGTEVTRNERKGSEIDYLKKACKQWLASGGSRETEKSQPSLEFLQLHPRYSKLLEVYGIPEDAELIVKSNTLKDGLIGVTIKCPGDSSKKVLQKKLPDKMEVKKLKSLIYKLLRVEVTAQCLTYTSKKVPDQEIALDNDMRELSFFSMESGDTILVRW